MIRSWVRLVNVVAIMNRNAMIYWCSMNHRGNDVIAAETDVWLNDGGPEMSNLQHHCISSRLGHIGTDGSQTIDHKRRRYHGNLRSGRCHVAITATGFYPSSSSHSTKSQPIRSLHCILHQIHLFAIYSPPKRLDRARRFHSQPRWTARCVCSLV